MTENNYVPDQNTAYPTASAYPAASTYSAAPTYSSASAYPMANAQYAQNPYASQMYEQAPKKTNGVAIGGFIAALLAVATFIIAWILISEASSNPFRYDYGSYGYSDYYFGAAIAVFVLFPTAIFLTGVGLSLSIVGVGVSKRLNSGLGLAIAGIILSAVMVVIFVIFLIIIIPHF